LDPSTRLSLLSLCVTSHRCFVPFSCGCGLCQFERERNYGLVIDEDTPELLEGDISRRFARTEAAVLAEAEESGGEDADSADENLPTHIRGWDCTADFSHFEDDEAALVSVFHQRIIEELRLILRPASMKALTTSLSILKAVLRDPTEPRFRAVNPVKVGRLDGSIPGLLKHCGFRENFLLEKNANFLVLDDGVDLLLLALQVRAVEAAFDARRVEEAVEDSKVVVVE
jgi:hypothetical protein